MGKSRSLQITAVWHDDGTVDVEVEERSLSGGVDSYQYEQLHDCDARNRCETDCQEALVDLLASL